MSLTSVTDRTNVTCGKRRAIAVFATICAMAGGLAVGGCGAQGGAAATEIRTTSEFDSTVQSSDKPVLVEFYKQGCPPCAILGPTIDKLAGEYQGQAVVAKAMVATLIFTSPMPEIVDKYRLSYVPVVMLFVDGKPVQRWDADFDIGHYRQALDQATKRPSLTSSSPE
jgi:thioredoxin 1